MVILCDSLRADFLNAYGKLTAIPTPNIDCLAEMGTVFTNATTVSTVCAPARASIMTGRYVSDHGVWTNDMMYRSGLDFIAERMNELGYMTAAFGILHTEPRGQSLGFQQTILMESGRLGNDEQYLTWLRERHPEVNRFAELHDDYTFKYPENEYYDYWTTSNVIQFLQLHHKSRSEKPFFAYVAYKNPHGPLDPPREVKGTVDSTQLPVPVNRELSQMPLAPAYRAVFQNRDKTAVEQIRERTAYAELIVEIDRQVGRILDQLRELRLLESTTVIFSADHGCMMDDFGLESKGPYPYRASLMIPMIVSNHPEIKPSTRTDSLVSNIDIPGTLLDIGEARQGIGVSRSMIDLASDTPQAPRDVIFSEFNDRMKIVLDKRYTYCYYPFSAEAECYDRETDPDERNSLAGKKEFLPIEIMFLKHIIEFGIIAKGVKIEAQDMIPQVTAGLINKHPEYMNEFEIAYPLAHKYQVDRLKKAGLFSEYNEFCMDKPVLVHYGLYWNED